MNAREYQHKRFSRGSRKSSNSSSSSTKKEVSVHSSTEQKMTKMTNMTMTDMTNMTMTNMTTIRKQEDAHPATPPRVVTPRGADLVASDSGIPRKITLEAASVDHHKEEQQEEDDGPPPRSPLLHHPTATNGGLTQVSPFKPTGDPVRYSLTNGTQVQKSSLIPPRSPGQGDRGGGGTSATATATTGKSKLAAAHSMALQRHQQQQQQQSRTTGTTYKPDSKFQLSSQSKIRKQDPNAYKIFLLLLQPQSKIFELIQLLYSPNDTTVGDIVHMIPTNATEAALGCQVYVGLCRPKTHQELLDLDQLASDPHALTAASASATASGTASAKITLGEILVAIPQGFTGPDVASLSKQILANPKIVKLLKRADPLAPKKSRRHHHHHKSRSSGGGQQRRSSRSKLVEQVHVLEKHDELLEEDEHQVTSAKPSTTKESRKDAERRMRQAMEHAAAEAAAANAAIPGGGTAAHANVSHFASLGERMQRSNSMALSETQSQSNNTMDSYSAQESLDDSYSSWSKSFEASFSNGVTGDAAGAGGATTASSSICSGVGKRTARRRDRHHRRMTILQRSTVAAFGVMVMFYWFDPNQEALHAQHVQQTLTPMGLSGIFQCLFLLLALYKMERLVRSRMGVGLGSGRDAAMPYMSDERSCPFLKASATALKRFKTKYSKKLKKQQQQQQRHGGAGHHQYHNSKYNSNSNNQEDDDSLQLSQKLRRFSLKAASATANPSAHLTNNTDTGSL